VVTAAYWDGLTTKEIAQRFGIPDGTVKSRLHHALKILRVHLQEREILS
jgi:RNA polymerase sigma-70 factor (ECF subfamily)